MQKENLIQQAQNLIGDYTAAKGVSKNRLAAKLKVTAPVLTWIEQGDSSKLSEDMLRTIIAALRPAGDFTILGTSNYNTIQAICEKTQVHSQMNAIVGYTGAGKTTGLHDYYSSKPNVYYIEVKNSMNRRQFLNALLLEMGINFMGSVFDMVSKISEHVNSQRKCLIIIDQAGKAGTAALLDLHDIRDNTSHNTGIILAGCEYFQTDMEKAVAKERPGYPEFYSRITNWNILNKPSRAEIKAICQSNGLNNEETIKDLYRLPNYRLLYNAILNEREAI